MAEVSNDFADALQSMIDGRLAGVNTAIEGRITAYADGYASIVPIGKKRFADGDELDFPAIHKVPIMWPSFAGGAAGCKGPILVGDKCLLVFAQQAADDTDDLRQHDMTDAYAIPFTKGAIGPSNDAMTLFFGEASISIDVFGVVRITAPYGVIVDTHVTAEGSITAGQNLVMRNGANGTFSTPTGQTVTVSGGVITNIA
jgi:hypothetical protein